MFPTTGHSLGAKKPGAQHGGARTCVGCGARVARDRVRQELVRVILAPDDRPVVDLAGRSVGRGAWVHARPACLSVAARKGLARALRARVVTDAGELVEQIRAAATRRVEALLGSARRAKQLAIGSTAVAAAQADGRLCLLLAARDAAAAAQRPAVAHALDEGKVLVWGDKAGLARALGSPRPVAVVAITDEGLAGAIRHAAALSEVSGR